MTARPRHLRLVATGSDAPVRATSGTLFGADWCAPALSVAHAGVAAPLPDARSALLLEAARTVLPPRPPFVARVGGEAARAPDPGFLGAPWGVPERTKTCRPLVLSGAQLAFLEDLALLRRARSFRCEEGPPADILDGAPEAGRVYVRRLLHPRASRGGPAAVTPRGDRPRSEAFAVVDHLLGACRSFVARCSRWLGLLARARGAVRDGLAGP